ncbi:hypothetical protein ACOSQ3_027642 [Xanthoceras sorbifolium]
MASSWHELQVQEHKLNALLRQDEEFWRQRARTSWLASGDKNTKYFHFKSNQRKKRNSLLGLFNSSGEWKSGSDDLEVIIHDYFSNIFGSCLPSAADFCAVTSKVKAKVSLEMNRVLDAKFSAVEVYAALKQMYPSKAPAYDCVEWGFLKSMMVKLGFSGNWIRKMIHCISSVTYSYLINGEVRGFLKLSKRLHQGDPLSPYLFLLYAEGLSRLLSAAERDRAIHGIVCGRGCPSVSHLFFWRLADKWHIRIIQKNYSYPRSIFSPSRPPLFRVRTPTWSTRIV